MVILGALSLKPLAVVLVCWISCFFLLPFFYDADVVASVSVVLSFVAAVVVFASAVVLFFGALVVPALSGSLHFLVPGFDVAVLLAVASHHMTTSIS